jgi:hypothetical protein
MSPKQGLLVTGAVLLVAITGCSAAPANDDEAEGSTSSKLLAPQASLTSAASAETTAKYGITHWKMFRGKQSLVMTGYDANKHAVKGVTIGFAKSSEGNAHLITQINDGSQFTAVHDFTNVTNLASQALSSDSQGFITSLASDASSIQQQLGGLLGSSAGAQCGSDMTSVLTSAMQCMGGSSSTASESSCINAAMNAANTASSCVNTGATTTTGATSSDSTFGSILSSLPSYTGGSPFDASSLGSLGSLGSSLGGVLSNPFGSGGSCSTSSPFGDSSLSNILGSATNGDCSFDQSGGGSSLFGSFSSGDSCSFGGFGGGDSGGY